MPASADGTAPGDGAARSARAVPLIGRTSELALFRDAVADVAGGAPVFLELDGVPGVGTTRLGHEAMRLAAQSGFTTILARAGAGPWVAMPEHEAPFAPFVEALGPLLRGPGTEHIVQGLDPLALVFSGLDASEPAPLGDPGLERMRLLDAFARLFERLAKRRPLAILLDDAHLADESSRRLLDYLAAALADRAALLVTTMHPGKNDNAYAALRAAYGSTSWRVHRHVVAPLQPADARDVLVAAAGANIDGAVLDRVVQHCAGRPAFLIAIGRELERSLSDGASLPVPDDLSARVLTRLTALDDEARDVVNALATAGGLGIEVLRPLCDPSGIVLVGTLDALESSGMVECDAGGRYTLGDGVLRDVVLGDLSRGQQQRLHARLADAYRVLGRVGLEAAELLAAGGLVDAERLASTVVSAANRMLRLGSPSDAERLLAAAVDSCDRMRAETSAELRLEYGRLLRQQGHIADARQQWMSARRAFAEVGDPVGRAVTDRELAEADWADGDLAGARSRLNSAVDALSRLEPTDAYAELLHAQAVNAVRVGDAEGLRAASDRLKKVAERMRSPQLKGRVALVNGAAALMDTDFVRAETLCAAGLASVTGSGDVLLEMRAHDQLAIAAAVQGDLKTLRLHSAASEELSSGIPLLAAWPRSRVAIADLAAGECDSALHTTSEAVEVAERAREPRALAAALATHALVLEHLGRTAAARAAVDGALRVVADELEFDRNVRSTVELADVAVALAEDRAAEALSRVSVLGGPSAGWLPLIGIALLGEAYARAGRMAQIEVLLRRIEQVRSSRTVLPAAVTTWLRAWINSVAADFDAAAAGFAELGLTRFAARAGLEAATSSGDDRAAAISRAHDAERSARRVGAVAEAERATRLLARLGVPSAHAEARRAPGGGLSPRELDVARLVAAGLSNAEIANRLYISPRTVTTHLQHVYARLGFGSRVGLTRFVLDSGLAEAPERASGREA